MLALRMQPGDMNGAAAAAAAAAAGSAAVPNPGVERAPGDQIVIIAKRVGEKFQNSTKKERKKNRGPSAR